MPKQYLDDNGNPIASPAKQYLDDDGNPVGQPAPTSAAPAPAPMERTAGNYASEAASGVGRGLMDDITGLYQTLRHPKDTANALVKQLSTAQQASNKEFNDLGKAYPSKYSPTRNLASMAAFAENAPVIGPLVQRAEQGGTRMGSPEAVGAAVEGATSLEAPGAVAKVVGLAPRIGEAATGTGSRVMRDVVKDTRAENIKAADKAAEGAANDRAAIDKANAKLAKDRAAEVKAHFDKTQVAKNAADQRSGIASRKAALESGVNKLSDKFQDSLKATRDKAAAEADMKYQKLNEALGGEQIPSESLLGHLVDASEKIKGSMTEPAIFKDIEKNVKSSDSISYGDLQGYYSELGRELKKGTLPGDVYTAYNTLQEAIGNEMQGIADKKDMGPQLADARASWRNLKQTFYDPKSPLKKALTSKEPGAAVRQLIGKDRTAIEALAKFDPDLAKMANTLRGYQEEASATKVPAASTKEPPALTPRPSPAEYPPARSASMSKIGPDEVQAAKANSLQGRADLIRHRSTLIATWPLFHVISDVVQGRPPNIASTGLEMAGTAGAGHLVAKMLENPKVSEFLTKATARDVAAIPEDLRGEFPMILKQATSRGIKVSSALERSFQGAAVLGPRKPEPNATDAWANPDQQ